MEPTYTNNWFDFYPVQPNEYGFIGLRHQKREDKQYVHYGNFYSKGPTIAEGWYLVHATTELYPVTRKDNGNFEGQFAFLI